MSLSTNWRENAGTFISNRDGDDATGNGSQATPYKTLLQASSGTIFNRLRSGFYQGQSNGGYLKGDGLAIWDGSGEVRSFNTSQRLGDLNQMELQNHTNLNLDGRDNVVSRINNSTFKNVSCSGLGTATGVALDEVNFVFWDSGVLYLNRSNLGGLGQDFFRCTWVDVSHNLIRDGGWKYLNNFFKGTAINYTTVTDILFSNSAFQSISVNSIAIRNIQLDTDVDTIGNTYASNEHFSGTVTIGTAVITFANCFYTDDPLFNNSAIGDYTLTPASPLVNGLNIIGRYSVALPLNAQSAPFTDAGASYTNVTPTGTKFILDVGQTEGTVTSTDSLTNCITLPFPTTVSEAVQAFGTFLYNQGEWIDKENYNPATNPEVRLTWEFSALDENTLIWGPFVNFEVGLPLETDNLGLGNGSVNADMADLGAITARRLRIRFTIRTNGV